MPLCCLLQALNIRTTVEYLLKILDHNKKITEKQTGLYNYYPGLFTIPFTFVSLHEGLS